MDADRNECTDYRACGLQRTQRVQRVPLAALIRLAFQRQYRQRDRLQTTLRAVINPRTPDGSAGQVFGVGCVWQKEFE